MEMVSRLHVQNPTIIPCEDDERPSLDPDLDAYARHRFGEGSDGGPSSERDEMLRRAIVAEGSALYKDARVFYENYRRPGNAEGSALIESSSENRSDHCTKPEGSDSGPSRERDSMPRRAIHAEDYVLQERCSNLGNQAQNRSTDSSNPVPRSNKGENYHVWEAVLAQCDRALHHPSVDQMDNVGSQNWHLARGLAIGAVLAYVKCFESLGKPESRPFFLNISEIVKVLPEEDYQKGEKIVALHEKVMLLRDKLFCHSYAKDGQKEFCEVLVVQNEINEVVPVYKELFVPNILLGELKVLVPFVLWYVRKWLEEDVPYWDLEDIQDEPIGEVWMSEPVSLDRRINSYARLDGIVRAYVDLHAANAVLCFAENFVLELIQYTSAICLLHKCLEEDHGRENDEKKKKKRKKETRTGNRYFWQIDSEYRRKLAEIRHRSVAHAGGLITVSPKGNVRHEYAKKDGLFNAIVKCVNVLVEEGRKAIEEISRQGLAADQDTIATVTELPSELLDDFFSGGN
mmetsp:Transcript_18873/g.30972  ORF Transcript_18873/g.30972 Transcript_18873/m.30972 type:complete len:515 (+) Transcript_18873:211-1755(+)